MYCIIFIIRDLYFFLTFYNMYIIYMLNSKVCDAQNDVIH